MPQAQNAVLSTLIADRLREDILGGRLKPGDRIRQEDIADESGASRIPVREALRILVTDGLVTMVSNAGAWVSSLTQSECDEQYEIRERLEPLLLRQSMPRLTDVTLRRLDELADLMEACSDVNEFVRLDREFHFLTYSGESTGTLAELVLRFWNTTQHYRRIYAVLVRGPGLHVTHLEHRLLIESIHRGDTEDAERILAGHIRRTRLELDRHPEIFEANPGG